MQNINLSILLIFAISFQFLEISSTQHPNYYNQEKYYEGSSNLINLEYHMGRVLTTPINIYIIWYGQWNPTHQSTIKDFITSFSSPAPFPSVSDWWRTVSLYTDQMGSNITKTITLSGEFYDFKYSHGPHLTRLSMQSIIKNTVTSFPRPLPVNYHNGLYLVLTSSDVQVQEFCRAVCSFHYFTFPSVVGVTLPYAWVGYSGTQCPRMCAYPFVWPKYSDMKPPPGTNNVIGAPNGDAGTDGIIGVIAHELAEVSSNPLVNAWYAGDDPTAPTEIADLCLGVYESGGGGGYVGVVKRDSNGNGYNLNAVKGRKYLVQWVWNPVRKRCFDPNALD